MGVNKESSSVDANLLLGDSGEYSHHYEGANIPIHKLNVLPQPRQTFEEIEFLAEDIARKKFLNPPTVADFDRDSCERYISVINLLWGTQFQITELVSLEIGSEQHYYVLLAGERRFRACVHLWDVGCYTCIEKFGEQKDGSCFRRHFKGVEMEVRLCLNIPPRNALRLQFSENIHMRVPAHQEARAYTQFYRIEKEADPNLSMVDFAREVGRSPETVRGALRFCSLPQVIQDAVEDGAIVYGIALELARLQEDGVAEEILINRWFHEAVAKQYNVPDFHVLITNHLEERHSPQMSMSQLFGEGQEQQLHRLRIRQVVGRHLVGGVHLVLQYLGILERHILEGKVKNRGVLSIEEVVYSEGSPIRVIDKLIRRLEALIPHLEGLVSSRRRERWTNVLDRAGPLVAELCEDSTGDERDGEDTTSVPGEQVVLPMNDG